jgi:AbrB family looped-hinge helix DNA binding protein
MLTTLTAKGQVTLPKSLRTRLNLQAGDRLDFVILENGIIQVVPLKQSPKTLKGIIPKPEKAVSIEEMNRAIIDGASDR